MKFTFLLILGFFYFPCDGRNFEVAGFLEKSYSGHTYSSGFRENGKVVYVNTSQFDSDEIEFEISVGYGDLTENCMYYGSNNTELPGKAISLSACETYYASDIHAYDDEKYFYYYFRIPKLNDKYLYVSIPSFKLYSYKGSASIMASDKNSLVSIILIIIGVVIFIVILIVLIIYFVKKKRNKKRISLLPESEEDNYPVAPPIQPYNTPLTDNTPNYTKNGLPIEPDYPPPPS